MVCHVEQTKPKSTILPVIDIKLDITPQEKTKMLVDTGAQISLINQNIIANQELINPENKITLRSIHGSESTLGDISATIYKNNDTIPVQLQVTKNSFLTEDCILGYDILGERAIINGPNKTVTINTGNSSVHYPICGNHPKETCNNFIIKPDVESNDHTNEINMIIQEFQNIDYLTRQDTNPKYCKNLNIVKKITQEINDSKIRIIRKQDK